MDEQLFRTIHLHLSLNKKGNSPAQIGVHGEVTKTCFAVTELLESLMELRFKDVHFSVCDNF